MRRPASKPSRVLGVGYKAITSASLCSHTVHDDDGLIEDVRFDVVRKRQVRQFLCRLVLPPRRGRGSCRPPCSETDGVPGFGATAETGCDPLAVALEKMEGFAFAVVYRVSSVVTDRRGRCDLLTVVDYARYPVHNGEGEPLHLLQRDGQWVSQLVSAVAPKPGTPSVSSWRSTRSPSSTRWQN